jgi:hypothetical protein
VAFKELLAQAIVLFCNVFDKVVPRASLRRWDLAVLVAIGFLVSSASAEVDSSTFSTGRSGGRLKWLSQRPASVENATGVTATGYTSPSAPQPLRIAQNQDSKPLPKAFSDPFDESKKNTPAPAKELGKEVTPQLPTEAKPQESLPAIVPEEPAAAEKPYIIPETPSPSPAQPKPAKKEPSPPVSEREFEPKQHDFSEGCPSPKDLKQISELTTNITPAEGELPHDCPLGNATFQPRSFSPVTFHWTASALCHKPLYFEDVQLERYGHMGGPLLQPLASATNFFLTFPILPYKMGLETPNECMYTLGYYRPGDCSPYLFDPLPLSVRGALFEAGAWVGGVYMIP